MAADSRWMLLAAVLVGACNVAAFAPFDLWPLQILALAWLFRQSMRTATLRRAMLIGWLYGFGWAAAGIHWLYISMHTYGGMPAWMAALAVALLAAYLGLYAALTTGAATWLRRRWAASDTTLLLLILPSLWALSEWIRGWLFTGFPWLTSGYAHSIGALAGFAPVTGVYGLSWIAALIAGALVLLLRPASSKKLAALVAVGLLAGGWALKSVQWTSPNGKPISVRLLQGNIAQEMKFSNEALLSSLMMYNDMISATPADLIATPETAVPLLPQQLPPDYLERLARFADTSGSHLVVGIPLSDGPGQYTNSAIGFSRELSGKVYRYDKHHLVPFGEFVPPGFRWFVDMMHIPLGDMTRGAPLQAAFAVKDQWVLPNICYEDLFGEEIAAQLAGAHFSGLAPASMLLNLSNIAWFGNSIALPQHLQISQMRALETGRPMLRATNTGATAVITPDGVVSERLLPFSRNTLAATVQGYQGLTPYILLGNKLMLALTLIMLAFAWRRQRQSRSSAH